MHNKCRQFLKLAGLAGVALAGNRRDFLKLSGITGVGLAGGQITSAFGAEAIIDPEGFDKKPGNHFNMSGYAAPKLDTVRIGFIGFRKPWTCCS